MSDLRPPLISIIIPAYNAGPFLAETLESIRAQDCPDWECIVVDDGSTDAGLAVAQSFAAREAGGGGRIRCLAQSNAGVAAARNRGFAAAHPGSRYIVFMDADDVYLPHALSTLRAALDAHPEMAAAHGLAETVDVQTRPAIPGSFPNFQRARTGFDGRNLVPWGTTRPATFETLIHHSTIYPPGLVLVRRQFVERVGAFDGTLSPVEDWDFLIRLTRLGPIEFVDRVILLYRRHAAQASTAALERINARTKLLRRKTFYSAENTLAQKTLLRGAHRAWQRMKIREKRKLAVESLAAGRMAAAVKAAAHIAGHALYLARGTPA